MRTVLFPFLFVASLLYRIGLSWDRFYKRRHITHLGRPVISVGNITWGGTGKTPVLIRLVHDLIRRGKKPAILTRGYPGFGQKLDQDSDEVRLMKEKCPGIPLGVGKDRVHSAQELKRNNSVDVYVLDDGFQHWGLHRDVDVVCVDAGRPWGPGGLIPLGSLREQKSGLHRAQVILVTRWDRLTLEMGKELLGLLSRLAPQAILLRVIFKSTLTNWNGDLVNPKMLNGKNILAISAIGNPDSFEANLVQWGGIVTALRYRDHYVYKDEDLKEMEREANLHHAVLVTTEKDAVKLRQTRWGRTGAVLPDRFVVKIDLEFVDGDQFKWEKFWDERL
jgi:tetraacyldisaccharide 4'-kinase